MGKYKKAISILAIAIVVLSLAACLAGLFSNGGNGQYEFRSINGEMVKIYGKGIYRNDSVAVAVQGIASDFITLVVGIPLLIVSIYLNNKGSFRGKILLTGTLGYFLYTYMSYTFLWMYNPFFLLYVSLMSLSLFAFILSMLSFELDKIRDRFKEGMPVKFLGGFQIFIAVVIAMLWLGRIAPSIFGNTMPLGLEHYTTLVIQGMDLGIVVPGAIVSGILLIRHKPAGYLLTSVILLKGITMLTAISAMIINQALNAVSMNILEVAIFPCFNLLAIFCIFILIRNTYRVDGRNGRKR